MDTHEFGTVFHTPYLYDVYLTTPNHEPYAFFAIDDNKQIKAMLTGFIQTVKPGVFRHVSNRSVMMQSPLFDNQDALTYLIRGYNLWIKNKAIYTEIRNHIIDDDYLKKLEFGDYKWEGHYNIIKELPINQDLLWKTIGRKRKDGINKAKKCSFRVVDIISKTTVCDFYELLSYQYATLGLPIPEISFFENCVSQDINNYCKYFQLLEDECVRIALLSFQYKNTLHAFFIGIDQDPEFIIKRPVDFFYYEVMKWCVNNNVKYFDWMGAGKPDVEYGVRKFKLQYGGELKNFGRYHLIHAPLRFQVAKSGFKIIQRLKKKT